MRMACFFPPFLFSPVPTIPAELSRFPFAFSQGNFVRLWYGVKSWQIEITATLTSGANEHTFTISDLVMVDSETDDLREVSRVGNPFFFALNTEANLPGNQFTGKYLDMDEFGVGTSIIADFRFCAHVETEGTRGAWLGNHGDTGPSTLGDVLPSIFVRLDLSHGTIIDDEYVLFSGTLTSADEAPPSAYDDYTTGAFIGRPLPMRYYSENATLTAFTMELKPKEWFEFSSEVEGGPVYDSATGFQILDPFTAPIP